MNKKDLIFKYFQRKDLLTVASKDYQDNISSLFNWLVTNDKVFDDKSSKYLPNHNSAAKIIAKESGIIAGMEEVGFLINRFTKLKWKQKINDGTEIKNNEVIAQIEGKSREILAYERTILNILQRMSGIATETKRLNKIIAGDASEGIPNVASPALSPTKWSDFEAEFGKRKRQDPLIPFIASTRKTPWMSLDKKAVAVGGGLTHRLNLSDGILIKDNHLKLLTISRVLETFLKRSHLQRGATSPGFIEIEVTDEKQAHQVLKTFQRMKTNNHLALLLDNFTPSVVKTLLSNLSNLYDISTIIFEASGGITQDNIKQWSQTGVDIISLGSLSHSSHALNLSLDFIKESSQKSAFSF